MMTANAPKRKREAQGDVLGDQRDDEAHSANTDGHTPKRSKSGVPASESALSDDPQTRSVRRKKGVRNLSNLNLRHAAKQQSTEETPRVSRFQEGSLNDKPSMSPPSMYMSSGRADSANHNRIDGLMADYHDPSVDDGCQPELNDNPTDTSRSALERKEGPKSMFKFGKSLAKFYPFGLWNRIYDEQHERLLQINIAEAERKAQLKVEAEARYAEMKKAGQFDHTFASNKRFSGETSTPHDSVVGLNEGSPSQDHQRDVSGGSELGSHEVGMDQDDSQLPATEQKPLRHSSSRFSLRKPSLSSFKNSLKRVASDLNLGYQSKRELSSSISPEKNDMHDSGFTASRSRLNVGDSKTDSLSRRVSDLERQLQAAREQLGEALEAASPVPRSTARYGNFTPSLPRNRKWVPGGLPTLPSERLLFPDAITSADIPSIESGDRESNTDEQQETAEATIKASSNKPMPAHVSTLFELDIKHETSLEPSSKDTSQDELAYQSGSEHESRRAAETDLTNEAMPTQRVVTPITSTAPDTLDAQLKQPDAQARGSKSHAKSKKRKSGVDEEDKAYKPGVEDDDDAEWEGVRQKSRKKLKANSKVDAGMTKKPNPSPRQEKPDKLRTSPKTKTPTRLSSKKTAVSGDEASKDESRESAKHFGVHDDQAEPEGMFDEHSDHALEPLYEEEEETSIIPLKDEPSEPTAQATPARYVRSASSKSHFDRSVSDIASVLRAGEVAQRRHLGVSASPLPDNPRGMAGKAFIAVPGENGVPNLPSGANGSFDSLDDVQKGEAKAKGAQARRTTVKKTASDDDAEFEWPEDVF